MSARLQGHTIGLKRYPGCRDEQCVHGASLLCRRGDATAATLREWTCKKATRVDVPWPLQAAATHLDADLLTVEGDARWPGFGLLAVDQVEPPSALGKVRLLAGFGAAGKEGRDDQDKTRAAHEPCLATGHVRRR